MGFKKREAKAAKKDKKDSKKRKKRKKHKRGGRQGLQYAILSELEDGPGLSKKQLVERFRGRQGMSLRKLAAALGVLLEGGWLSKQGARANATFHAVSR